MYSLEKLIERIKELHTKGAYHVKRGFSLKDAKKTTASNHLIEEVVELQAEVLDGNYFSKTEEAADVLLVYLHLLLISGICFTDVIDFATSKIEKNFTLDPSKIKTKTPGYTRKNRNDKNSIHERNTPFEHWEEPC